MSDEEAKMSPPSKKLQLGDQQLSMSYMLLMDVSRMLPDPASVMQLLLSDPVTQDYVVRRMLTPISRTVNKVEDLIEASEVELDSDEIESLLTWVAQHILYFFVRRTKGLQLVGNQFRQALPSPSGDGSES